MKQEGTSTITIVEKSKQARCSSLYFNNRTYTTIAREDASAKVNNTNIVYNTKNDSLTTPENKDMATSEKLTMKRH